VTERTTEHVGHEPAEPQPDRGRGLPDAVILAVLIFDGLLLGVFGLMFTPLYTSGIPVPMGAVLSFLVLPWLVARAAEISPRPAVAGAPLLAWVVAIAVLLMFGPGGDSMLIVAPLSAAWPSLSLVAALLAGLWALRTAIERGYQGDDG
jgi:hypothetical protein